jgi:DNA-binding response OmpR family regulator
MITAGSTAYRPWLAATGLHPPEANGRAHILQVDEPVSAADRSGAQAEGAIAFGPFHLLPTRRLLLRAGKPVRLGSRALEILITLIERPGELVSKTELIARVWPDTFVEEGNLKVQVAGLRRALGDSPRQQSLSGDDSRAGISLRRPGHGRADALGPARHR